jgi:DNA-binding CsgD family transcriptional regulator
LRPALKVSKVGAVLGASAARLPGRHDECDALDGLINAVRAGDSRVLVLRGEPGIGKTALLDYLEKQATGFRVLHATGVQSEMELAFAGLHQLCASALDRLDGLPAPQRDALRTAFGLSAGPPPDRFLVALAVLGLLSDLAGDRPLLCVVDDEQWLDRASAQALGFAARRLGAEPVGLVFAARVPGDELAGLPELPVDGLREADAQALLDSVLAGRLDARVRDLFVAETRGNPLALLELPRALPPDRLAGGFGLPGAGSGSAGPGGARRPRAGLPGGALAGRIEDSFRERIATLSAETQQLLRIAAADPSGDPLLVLRAAELLGVRAEAVALSVEDGLVEFGARVRFRHPLVRSAVYRSASADERRDVHSALAEATDPVADPDRRGWHRAQSAPGPDEQVAAELEHSASRAQSRGGLAAAAAFLERAALLSPEPVGRARRLLAAARAKRHAGAPDAALGLLVAVESGPLETSQTAAMEHLRGQIALDQGRATDAARLLLSAARRLEPVDAGLARETHMEALGAAMWAGQGVRAAAEAALAAPPGPEPPRAVDLLLDVFALRLTEGYAAAAPAATRALQQLVALRDAPDEATRWQGLTWGRAGQILALDVWDFGSWHTLAAGQVEVARAAGALVHLQFALNLLARTQLLAGDLALAARSVEEDRLIADATGNPPVAVAAVLLTAFRGGDGAAELIGAATRRAAALGVGGLLSFAAYASSVLDNGLGKHDTARDAARQAFERDPVGYGPLAGAELAEAATRTGDVELVRSVRDWLAERTPVTRSDWLLGIEALVNALLEEDADACYRQALEYLGRTPLRAQQARTHLLYGEWLRREQRRGEAREQLRIAHERLEAMGLEAFAERARRELAATGEAARKRDVQRSVELTAQEEQVARLARDGLSNPQIGTRLFLSARTVQYHLGKVFTKLGITSRSQLAHALPD